MSSLRFSAADLGRGSGVKLTDPVEMVHSILLWFFNYFLSCSALYL